MNLVHQCQQFEQQASRYREQERDNHRLRAYQERWARVSRRLQDLRLLCEELALFAGNKALSSPPPDSLAAAQEAARALAAQVRDDADLQAPGHVFEACEQRMEAAIRELGPFLASQWAAYVETFQLPVTAAEVAPDLNHVDVERKRHALVLKSALDAFEKKAKQRPRSVSDFSSFRQARQAIDTPLAAYRATTNLPPEIEHFFQEVTRQNGIPLHALNPAVLDWLRDNGRLQLFRVIRAQT